MSHENAVGGVSDTGRLPPLVLKGPRGTDAAALNTKIEGSTGTIDDAKQIVQQKNVPFGYVPEKIPPEGHLEASGVVDPIIVEVPPTINVNAAVAAYTAALLGASTFIDPQSV
jgi:hypothetical protein